jgi:hypothetical protein
VAVNLAIYEVKFEVILTQTRTIAVFGHVTPRTSVYKKICFGGISCLLLSLFFLPILIILQGRRPNYTASYPEFSYLHTHCAMVYTYM